MDNAVSSPLWPADTFDQEGFLKKLTEGLRTHGYCVLPSSLPFSLQKVLLCAIDAKRHSTLKKAAVGRLESKSLEPDIRCDKIEWMDDSTEAGSLWLAWMNYIKRELNRELLLGLFSFESHFARYGVGDFYRRHSDSFAGQANRVLSVVAYLNPQWQEDDGGELVIYQNNTDHILCKVKPELGTLVFFLSEEFPHEVLPAKKSRWSIAGWFRVNTSIAGVLDPPA